MKVVLLACFAALTWTAALNAQAYEPRQSFPSDGSEVVLVFISWSTCTGNSEERLDDVVAKMKEELRTRAQSDGHAFYAIGAAAEWSVDAGVAYLLQGEAPGYSEKQFGAWDEIWVGRDWLNNAAVKYIWQGDGRSTLPQLIVLQRPITMGADGIEVGPSSILARVVGSKQIVEWYDAGMQYSLTRAR